MPWSPSATAGSSAQCDGRALGDRRHRSDHRRSTDAERWRRTPLMLHVLDRAAARRFPGVRLVQAAFHNRSLSLYTKLGFDAREPLSAMQGPPISRQIEGYRVRGVKISDL